MNEKCERRSEQRSDWSSTYVLILGCSDPLWANVDEDGANPGICDSLANRSNSSVWPLRRSNEKGFFLDGG